MPTYGSKNQPLIATTDTFNPATDINTATNWGATFANLRVVASAAVRNALAGSDLWDGLTVWQQDTDEFYTYNGSAWLLNAGVGTPPRIELTKTGTQTSNNGTNTTQTGWTVTSNRGGFTEASGVITIPRTGKYNIFGQIAFAANSTGYRALTILVNGNITFRQSGANAASIDTAMAINANSVQLTAGQTVALSTIQGSGGSLNTTGATVPQKFIVEWAGE